MVFKVDVTKEIVAGLIAPAHSTLFDYVSKSIIRKWPRTAQTFSDISFEFITGCIILNWSKLNGSEG